MENSLEYQKQIAEQLLNSIKSANRDISHGDFVAGVKRGTMGFKVMFGEPNKLLYGSRKTMFKIFVMFYMVVPLILIPILCYYANNWWLLLGIPCSYLFSFFATMRNNNYGGRWTSNLIYYFLIFCIVYWIRNGFHLYDYVTFFFFSSLWGTFFFKVADQSQFIYALQILTENENLFNSSIETNQIMIIRKDAEDRNRKEEQNEEKASRLLDIADSKFQNGDFNGAVNDYTKSIEFYPFVSAFENRGDAKMKLMDYNGAIQDFSGAIERMPSIPNRAKFANIYAKRAEAHRLLGHLKEAESDLQEARKLSPSQ
jgi:tetratricopeptide (TPR) repeat protein